MMILFIKSYVNPDEIKFLKTFSCNRSVFFPERPRKLNNLFSVIVIIVEFVVMSFSSVKVKLMVLP